MFLVQSRNAPGRSGNLRDGPGCSWTLPVLSRNAPGRSGTLRHVQKHSRNASGLEETFLDTPETLRDAPGRSSTLQHAPGRPRSWTFQDGMARSGTTPEMLWDARRRSGTLQHSLVHSETLQDASGILQTALNGFRELWPAQFALDGCSWLWTVHLVKSLVPSDCPSFPFFQRNLLPI